MRSCVRGSAVSKLPNSLLVQCRKTMIAVCRGIKMNHVNRILLMLIAMAAIMLMAVGIDKGMKFYEHKKWEEEREAYYEEARTDIAKMQETIQTLSEDQEALTAFFSENHLDYVELRKETAEMPKEEEGMLSEEELLEIEGYESSVTGNGVSDDTLPENPAWNDSVSADFIPGGSVSGNFVSGNSIPEGSVSGNSVSGNSVSGNSVSDNSISGNSISGNGIQEKEICASYEETIKMNHADRKTIEESAIDFSGKKIACLGDSITAAANLEKEEDYLKMSYPYQLGKILNAKEVVNLGIGGSSIGRYWENAFVDRYQEIPEDTDIIIVMGGTNDGFCASEKELGTLEKREERTFAGDLDELLKALKEDYPDARIVLVTPLSNVVHDMLRRNRSYLCPQSAFAAMMKQLAAEYGISVIDLYNSGILDSHDAAVIHNFIPDGVHGNEMGYRILAEHIAAELIRMEEAQKEAQGEGKEPENEQ